MRYEVVRCDCCDKDFPLETPDMVHVEPIGRVSTVGNPFWPDGADFCSAACLTKWLLSMEAQRQKYGRAESA